MTGVIVGKVVGVVAVANDENLQEAKQGFSVAVAWVVFVFNDLLHCAARIDTQRFQLNLNARHTIDENEHIEAVVAVVGVDA
ncbi:hypothetical protein D3C73_803350 [compost metagenome]